MKKAITILYAALFAICGMGLGLSTKSPPPIVLGNGLQLNAAAPNYFIPSVLSNQQTSNKVDTTRVEEVITDSIRTITKKVKPSYKKYKRKKVIALPDPIVKQDSIHTHDTIYVEKPVIYVLKRVEQSEISTDTTKYSIYEVHQISDSVQNKFSSGD